MDVEKSPNFMSLSNDGKISSNVALEGKAHIQFFCTVVSACSITFKPNSNIRI